MKIHVLTDNRPGSPGFGAEHGLSVFIQNGANILFDTGQTDLYVKNAALAGVALLNTAYIVLSHGHYDHCGGLPFFPEGGTFPQVFMHRGAFAGRYSMNGNERRDVGIPWRREEISRLEGKVVMTGSYKLAAPDTHILGGIPRICDFEDTPKGFFLQIGGKEIPDLIQDEQMLVVETPGGLAVFLGCSHPGVINCIRHVKRSFPGKKILAAVGGMHLGDAGTERIRKTADQLMKMEIGLTVPLHCTGMPATYEIKRVLKEKCTILGAGDTLVI